MNSETLRIFRCGFAYAIEALLLALQRDGVVLTPEEKKVRNRIMDGEKIDWNEARIYQDRFATYFNNCRLNPSLYNEYRDLIFSGAPRNKEEGDNPV